MRTQKAYWFVRIREENNMSSFIDSRLRGIKAYVPGEQPVPGKYIKLNTNEFPYPPADSVCNATARAVKDMNLYCDLSCNCLKKAFEKVYGYGGSNVVFTNGSDEALYLCFLAFCGQDVGVAFPDITYGFYSVYADLCGLSKQVIPLNEAFEIVPSDYFNVGRTIFIANPNAPTGKKLSNEDVESILQNNPNNIVVIDEAYADFSGSSCRELLPKYKNLVVVGTFSKSRGMAGARLGYLIASEEIVEDIEKVKFSINPYNVNSLTQATGEAVLVEQKYYEKCVAEICNTRDAFASKLKEIGFDVLPSYTNFVFAKHSAFEGKVISEELRKRSILVRHFNSERIKDFVRITIGTPEQMTKVIEAIEEIVGGNNEKI